MDSDLEFGKLAAHGFIVGAAGVAQDAIEQDSELTEAQRQTRHVLAAFLQVVSHTVVNATADAIAKRRKLELEGE